MKGIGVIALLLGVAGSAAGQRVYGASGIGIWTNGVESYSATWTDDYSVAQYYDVITYGWLMENWTTIRSDSSAHDYFAEVYLSAPWSLNKEYRLYTDHYLRFYYSFYDWQTYTTHYQDPFGFSLMSTSSQCPGSA